MKRFDALLNADAGFLLGRKAGELIVDVFDDTMDQAMTMEVDRLRAYVMARSIVLAPTATRNQAVDLMALASCLCESEDEVDELIVFVRDWLDRLGDLRGIARRTAAIRLQAHLIVAQTPGLRSDAAAWGGLHEEDRMALDAAEMADIETSEHFRSSGGVIRFYLHDATTIAASTTAYGYGTAIVGTLDVGDGGSRLATPTPELVA